MMVYGSEMKYFEVLGIILYKAFYGFGFFMLSSWWSMEFFCSKSCKKFPPQYYSFMSILSIVVGELWLLYRLSLPIEFCWGTPYWATRYIGIGVRA